ncbi:MAG: aldo/keto reductase [candidate division Zixibacteria bacterium]|nr:aldo/keto reductase [candidate division Zixibacteria bacterium]
MSNDFTHTVLGHTGLKVYRLGLSASYRPGKEAVYKAIEMGVNYFFCYGFDTQMTGVLREIFKTDREKYIVATGAYNLLLGHFNLRRTLEKRLRQLGTDYIDVFQYLGVTREKHLTEHILEEFEKFKQEGKIRFTGLSTHHRRLAGHLAAENKMDVLMIRYNAAHRGAEEDIFPYLKEHNTGLVSYTATRWSYLIRQQRGWPDNRPIPTPGMAYRFVLSNPHVHVCLTAPSNIKQLQQNITALDAGPLSDEEMKLIKDYGDLVHSKKKWFM